MSRRFDVRAPARWLMLGALVTAVVALGPLVASAEDGDHGVRGDRPRGEPLMLGFTLRATGPTTTAGTFVASGAVQAAGETAVEGLTVVPLGHHDRGALSGTQRFASPQGVIVTRFRGTAHAISTNHQWGRGRFRIVDATGDYAGLRGGGALHPRVQQDHERAHRHRARAHPAAPMTGERGPRRRAGPRSGRNGPSLQ